MPQKRRSRSGRSSSRNSSVPREDSRRSSLSGQEPTASQSDLGKATQRPKKKQKDLNRKGVGKAGTEMDAFVEPTPAPARDPTPTPPAREPTPQPVEKAKTAEKPTAPVIEFIQQDEVEGEESSPGDEGTDIEAIVAAKNEENAKVTAALAATNNNNITSPPAGKEDQEETVEAEADENDDPQNIKSMTIERSTASAPQAKFNCKDDVSGEWTPATGEEGKKVYDRDFLLEMKNAVLSLKKPDFNLDLDIFRDKPHDSLPGRRNLHGSSSMSSRGDSVGQQYIRSSNSSSQRPMSKMSGRDRGPPRMGPSLSQSGIRGMGKGYTSVNSFMSSREPEPVLHKDPNGWKPARFQAGSKEQSEEQRQIEKLQKQIRGILNKLTPQKFEKLVGQILDLPIETEAQLKEMVNLVFEKAVDEPSFSKAYADLCQRLQKKVIQIRMDANGGQEGQAMVGLTYRKLLLNKCQEGFEKNKADELDIVKRQEEIDETTDAEKRKELKMLLEEDERKIRRKSVGLVRFIGELYKLHMLTPKIMHGCISTLLSQVAEEPLECLCKLLTTIGKELEKESGKKEFDEYFSQMNKLSQKTPDSKVSSRIRFMLQDVIELRQKGWKPRRDENNPKTIEQIHKEAERDALESAMLSAPAPNPRRQHNDRRNIRGSTHQDTDGWQTPAGKYNRNTTYTNTIEASKLQHLKQSQSDPEGVSLGGSGSFSQWGYGSGTQQKRGAGMDSSKNAPVSNFTNNKFAMLAQHDERMNKPPYSGGGSSLSKGKGMLGSTSIEKDRGMGMMRDRDDRDRRIGSGPPSRETSRPRYGQAGNSPAGSLNSRPERDFRPEPSSRYANQPDTREPTESRVPAANAPELDEDEAKRKADTIFGEWVANNDAKETLSTVNDTFVGQRNQCTLVRLLLNKVIEGKPAARIHYAELLVVLLKEKKTLTSKDVITEFGSLIEFGDDMVVDIPFFWTFVGQIFAPLIENDVVSFDEMKQALEERPHQDRAKVLSEVFKALLKNHKTNVWTDSGANLSDFVTETEIEGFIKNNNFWFLSSAGDNSQAEVTKHRDTLVEIISTDSDKAFDDAFGFLSEIEGSVPKRAFIEIVTTAVIKASLRDGKLIPRQLQKLNKLIQKYVDNTEELELLCLYAIKNFVVNQCALELQVLTESFRLLYDESVISVEAFKKWMVDTSIEPSESEGRLIANRALNPFYVFLAEADDDDEDS